MRRATATGRATEPTFTTVPRRPASSSGCSSIGRTAARLVRNSPVALVSHHALPAFVRALVQRPVAEPPPADPGDVQQDIEPAAENVEREREQPRRPRLRRRRARARIPRPGRAERADPAPRGRSPASRPATTTRAPSSRNRRAEARPMPLVPPTIRQVRPSSLPARGTCAVLPTQSLT